MSFPNKTFNSISISQSFVLSRHTYLSKKIVCISNIPNSLFTKDILYQKKFCGQYGHIKQMILATNKKNENLAIIHFDTVNQASLSVLSLHNFEINNNKLQINYFITKYCHNFLNNQICNEYNCLFLHDLKMNDYSFIQLKNKKNIDSYKFALDVLHIDKPLFENIYRKLIGENYYQKHMKFPKLTMKKLKNVDYINNLLKKDEEKIDNYHYNQKNSQNSIDENQKSTSDNSYESEKIINDTSYIFKNKQKSRFNFVNLEKNDNLSVFVPEKFLDFIDKTIYLYFHKTINFNDRKNDININNYNFKWHELIKIFNL